MVAVSHFVDVIRDTNLVSTRATLTMLEYIASVIGITRALGGSGGISSLISSGRPFRIKWTNSWSCRSELSKYAPEFHVMVELAVLEMEVQGVVNPVDFAASCWLSSIASAFSYPLKRLL